MPALIPLMDNAIVALINKFIISLIKVVICGKYINKSE